MLNKVSSHLHKLLDSFSCEDSLLFQNKQLQIDKRNFREIVKNEDSTISFIDGGQATIFNSGNICVTFVQIVAVKFRGLTKVSTTKYEFYVVTHSQMQSDDVEYVSHLFSQEGELLCNPDDLQISSTDQTIRNGLERAPIEKVANMARRFAELALARKEAETSECVLLDGTLEAVFRDEEKFIKGLPSNVCALAKTCSLITTNGNNPTHLLSKIAPESVWFYTLTEKTFFVKLHAGAKHVFRFEGDSSVLSSLVEHSSDSLFLGYPYGLIFVDRLARISNKEKDSLRMQFLLRKENKKIREYLSATNAHEILDSIG